LVAPIPAATSANPSGASPSTPRVAAVANTSGDWEFARKLFIELNREAIGIPDDWALVDLVSDDEDVAIAYASKAKEVTPGDDEERTPRQMTDRQSKPTCLPVHQAPELGEGHLDRVILGQTR
jgi:hypothetical protein